MSGREGGGHQLSPPFKISQFADDGVLFTASMLPTFKITIFFSVYSVPTEVGLVEPN